MSLGRAILLRMFGRPHGLLGRLGGIIMARTNRSYAAWVVDTIGVQPEDNVLDIGCGPGVAIELLAAKARRVAGLDPSAEMLRQAGKRNAAAIREGRVELRQGTADRMPFADDAFDKAMAMNSMQVWPDATAGLREVARVLKPGGQAAFSFSTWSGQKRDGVAERIAAAGFADCRVVETDQAFCVIFGR